MNAVLHDLHRLIALNHAEQWVSNHIAFEQLQIHGDRLIPGLIDCLGDENADVRLLTVELLNETESEAAIPALVKVLSDPARPIRVAAAHSLAKYGTNAVDALPILESWLRDDHKYVRIVATVTILRVDPSRRPSLLPWIQAALLDENPMVRTVAESFFTGE